MTPLASGSAGAETPMGQDGGTPGRSMGKVAEMHDGQHDEPAEASRPVAGEATAVLVVRSRAGDQAAFGELVARYQAPALGLALYHVHHREEAFDVAQDAFVAAFLHLHELDDPHRFGGWL